MAGYVLYSLGWDSFQRFIDAPSDEQCLVFAGIFAGYLDEYLPAEERGDGWPEELNALADLAGQRLVRSDWYGDLSEAAKTAWEAAVFLFCQDEGGSDVDFAFESDGVYWDVIDIARRHYGLNDDTINELVVSQFGTRPFRYRPEVRPRSLLKRLTSVSGREPWRAMHSMHAPSDVRRLANELQAARPTFEEADGGNLEDYETELLPVVEKVAQEGRMLFVHVDT